MAKKVNELARELDLTDKEIMEAAIKAGIEVKTSMSSISDENVEVIKRSLRPAKAVKAAPKTKKAETKVVRAKQKVETEVDKGESPVAVKQAKVTRVPKAKATRVQKPTKEKPAEKPAIEEKPVEKTAPKATGTHPARAGMLKSGSVKRVKKEKVEAEAEAARKAEEAKAAEEARAAEKARVAEETKKAEAAKEAEAAKKAEEQDPLEAKATETTVQEKAPEEVAPVEEPVLEQKEEKPAEKAAPQKKAATKEKRQQEVEAEKKEPSYQDNGRQRLKIIKRADEEKPVPAANKRTRPAQQKNTGNRPQSNRPGAGDAPADRSDKRGPGARGKKGKDARDNRDRDKFGSRHPGAKNDRNNYPSSLEKKARKKHVKQKIEPEVVEEEVILPIGTKVVNVPITIAGFCEQVGVTVAQVIMTLLKMGVVANQNQNIDEVTVSSLADELGINVVIGQVEEEVEEEGLETFEDREKDLVPRAPIITVMGHVDHGKTSLLDAIRKTNVTASESGGITQHIGASEVEINGQKIVFLDTPGHEAFTAMRARGADITDIAVLVVAADDSVKPQTIESISHAKAAGVPVIVAINKMDKPGANPDIVKKDLSDHGLLVEDWGGDVICAPVSAKTGDGIVNLLEMILLQAEVLELKANPDRLAMGTVIEARLDKAKGPVATLLVHNGTLKAGQSLVAGTCAGRIRLMTNSKGETIRKAGPATAVEILGLSEVPAAGDKFNAVSEDKVAKEIADKRKQKQRDEVMARTSGTTLEELFSNMEEGQVKELNLIVKGDVMGSVGAVNSSLEKLSNENVRVKIVHSGVGAINESDVILAGTSDAIIIGFNVRPTAAVQSRADSENVQIRTYRVIYDIIDDVSNAMKGMLDPEFKEEVLGEVEVRETFKVPGVGIIAGAYVTKGKILRNGSARLVREGIVIHEGDISSLKRFKDDAKEVAQGFECGIGLLDYNDIKIGDVIECYHMVEVERE